MRLKTVRWAQKFLLLVIGLAVLAVGWSFWRAALAGEGPVLVQALFNPARTLTNRHIGIVAGHSGNDSGAICPDGLTEAGINQAVANVVAKSLKQQGATVDLLQEFDQRLRGYQADAFVSIHTDSCDVDLSGFKVASLEGGSAASERLAECLWERYEAVTSLQRHPDTITYDMSRYHAFREIADDTPAAIIEIGFMKGDRELLTKHPDRVAAGIVGGVECFLTQ